jgi:hypothetical protein
MTMTARKAFFPNNFLSCRENCYGSVPVSAAKEIRHMRKSLVLIILFIFCSHSYSQDSADKTLLETMNQTDTLFIRFSSAGEYDYKCAATRKNTLKLYYINGQLKAQTKKGEETIISDVDSKRREFLIATEKESHLYDDADRFCKYSDGYWYYLNSEFKFKIIDQSCEWHGFTKMTEMIFGFAFP